MSWDGSRGEGPDRSSSAAIANRMRELRERSQSIAASFAEHMQQLEREAVSRPTFISIVTDRDGRIAEATVDHGAYGSSTMAALSAAASAALALVGISTMPDVSERVRRVVDLLQRGYPTTTALREATEDERWSEAERYDFDAMSVEIDRLGLVSVTAKQDWCDRAVADEFAAALRSSVNAVLDARGRQIGGGVG